MMLLLSLLLTITPPQTDSSIASQHADYDGTSLRLEGDVSLEHEFGIMKAGRAALSRQLEQPQGFPFASIELQSGVHMELASKAQVSCETANLDFSTLQGSLSSPQEVHYTDTFRAAPFELFTPQLDLQMAKDSTYSIQQAIATQGVRLVYDTLYHLKTESITLSGDLLLGPHPCVWNHGNDTVSATSFELDLAQNRLHLQSASGTLSSFSQGNIHFTSEKLHWDHADGRLILEGAPQVEESGLGKIISSQEISLLLHNDTVYHLTTKGETSLTSKKGHVLTTEGPIMIDQETHLATISSPLVYKEEEMLLEALSAQIHYQEDDKGFHPASTHLQGRVKISSPDIQGIADTLIYDPETRHCILKAEKGQKVLFARKQDSLQMSASEVHITYDPISKEQKIQGLGLVAFSLSLEEQKLLSQVFHHASHP